MEYYRFPPVDKTPRNIRELRAKKEEATSEIRKLKNQMENLNPKDKDEGPIWEDKNKLKKKIQLWLDMVGPKLDLVAAEPRDKIRIQRLQKEYDLAYYEHEMYYAQQEKPVNEDEVGDLRSRIEGLKKDLEENPEQG